MNFKLRTQHDIVKETQLPQHEPRKEQNHYHIILYIKTNENRFNSGNEKYQSLMVFSFGQCVQKVVFI